MDPKQPDIVTSASSFFQELVHEGLTERKINTFPLVSSYLAEMLQHFVSTNNLFEEDEAGRLRQRTLAEQYLEAFNVENKERIDRLKRLGDSSLYISGFFGDSLKRKIVDIDYYAEIGGSAYSSLAKHVRDDILSKIYTEFSGRFMEFVDVLTYISQKAQIQSNEDILRLYDKFVETGSELAKEQLLEKGIVAPGLTKKITRQ